jgi:hypothetical protein
MNKMKTLFITLLCMGAGTLSAQTADSTQTSPWTKEGFAGLKLTQVSLTNWAAGGDNSVAFDLQGTYQINYKKGKHLWNNRIELAYGLNKTGDDGTRKANDKIYLNTNYGYAIAKVGMPAHSPLSRRSFLPDMTIPSIKMLLSPNLWLPLI